MFSIIVACSIFYKPILLTDFLKENNSRVDFNRALSADTLREFEKSIKGIMVEPTNLTIKRRCIVRGLTRTASETTFTRIDEKNNESMISVAEYFHSTKRPLM